MGRDPREYGALVNGKGVSTGHTVEIRSPYNDSLVAVIHRAGPEEIEAAIHAAVAAFQTTRRLPSWKRSDVLDRRAEVDRASFTFKVASEEARRIYGEIVPLDWQAGNEDRVAQIYHVPLGVVAGITPFNFPLNLVAHSGREGLRYAIEGMTELKLLALHYRS